ncbi:MAG: hypothetical protein JKX98_05155 [Alcanivoracaceae bacterium]|nr:hypothetical protein [Alcanivoracaceae bacterium]
MNKKLIERQVQAELEHYFEYARAQKCPPGMKRKLYHQLEINSQNSKATSWFPARLTLAGLSLVFVSSVVFKVSNYYNLESDNMNDLKQAQVELQIAMHYMNQVSFKSLTLVNNKGLKPGLIKPLARSVASL